jgi:hypothetical protein
MPFPMIHFSIANKMFKYQPHPSFLLGSIAPDAILVREKYNKVDKDRSHLEMLKEYRVNLETLIQFYKDTSFSKRDVEYQQFLLGYVSHIYAARRKSI